MSRPWRYAILFNNGAESWKTGAEGNFWGIAVGDGGNGIGPSSGAPKGGAIERMGMQARAQASVCVRVRFGYRVRIRHKR